MWCLLDVPHLARLSRLCREQPRPCSRRLPGTGAVFVFFVPISQAYIRTYTLVGTYQSRPNKVPGVKVESAPAGRPLAVKAKCRWSDSGRRLFLFVFCHFHFFVGAMCFVTSLEKKNKCVR